MSKGWFEVLGEQSDAIVNRIFNWLKEDPHPKKIKAIKAYRDATGLELKEGKRRIDYVCGVNVLNLDGLAEVRKEREEKEGVLRKVEAEIAELEDRLSDLKDKENFVKARLKDISDRAQALRCNADQAEDVYRKQMSDDIFYHHADQGKTVDKALKFDAAVEAGKLSPLS